MAEDVEGIKYHPSFCATARGMCKLGATDYEVYTELGISKALFYRYRRLFADFDAACRLGKRTADARVEQALYHKAVGYTFDSEKLVTVSLGEGMGSEVQRHAVVEHVPPSDRAIEYWLNNRKSREWQHRVTQTHEGSIKFENIQRDDADMRA